MSYRRPLLRSGFGANVGDGPPRLLGELLQPIRCISAFLPPSSKWSSGHTTGRSKWSCKSITSAALFSNRSSSGKSRRSALPSLSSDNRQHKCKPCSPFQASGRENLRVVLAGCNGGSVNQFKMLLLSEELHEASLQALLHQQPGQEVAEFEVAAADPAWCEDLIPLTRSYARSVRQRLFWCGSCLHQPESDDTVTVSGTAMPRPKDSEHAQEMNPPGSCCFVRTA